MDLNQTKKVLYKQKPPAFFNYIEDGVAHYRADIDDKEIWFHVPVNDMGEARFDSVISSQLLIRWVVI